MQGDVVVGVRTMFEVDQQRQLHHRGDCQRHGAGDQQGEVEADRGGPVDDVPADGRCFDPVTRQYFPHIDYNKMFKSVWDHLAEKKCVAIFPEGGSHDQSNFLPFKAGVSIMSLGFLSQYPDSDFYLIPVGMNYFKRDSFRQ